MNYFLSFESINMIMGFMTSALLVGILIPKISLIAFKKKLFDSVDDRKTHQGVVPRLGGVAFQPAILFSFILLLGVNMLMGRAEILANMWSNWVEILFGFCAIIILYLIGIADDLIGVRYRAKFAVQILCGLLLSISGLWISDLHGLLGLHHIPVWVGYPLTVFIVVFIVNAINLIDGIDGLSSGLSSVALIFYSLIFLQMQEYIFALLSFAALGALVPFFFYNVFGNVKQGRKIFMGDTGSLTIGIIMCILSLKVCTYSPGGGFFDLQNPIALAFAPLIVPCFDVIRVFFHRIRNHKHPFAPDRNHIHHKLLALGMHQHGALVAILLTSILLTISNFFLAAYININLLLAGDVAGWTLVNMWLSRRIKRKNTSSLKTRNLLYKP